MPMLRSAVAFLSLMFVVACGDNASIGDPPDRDSSNGDSRAPGARDATDSPDGSGSAAPDAADAADVPDAPEADVTDDGVSDAEEDGGNGDDATPDAVNDAGADVVDAEPPDVEEDGEACVEIAYVADEANRPADVIWVIDSSESMGDEIDQVQANINEFTAQIASSGVDARVVMIASKYNDRVAVDLPIPLPIPVYQEYLGVCVPPPLSAEEGCPDTDNPPRFLHPHVNVYSTDALTRLFESYDLFRDVLRPWAKTHIVVVTDDSSSLSRSEFESRASGLAAPGFTDLAFHSIVDETGTRCGDGPGDDYIALSNATGGVVQSVCLADWQPIFDALFEQVLEGAQIPCAFGIPAPPDDAEIVPDEVNVYLTPEGGEEQLVRYVDDAASCTAEGGWYYDDPDDPATVYLCPAVCGEDREGAVDIAFGCRTVKV